MSSCWLGPKVKYHKLGHKEKESFNAAHLMAIMAKWGYLEASRINGDNHGADLLFYRSSDGNVMKIQLKGRVTLDKKYSGKDLYIAFPSKKETIINFFPSKSEIVLFLLFNMILVFVFVVLYVRCLVLLLSNERFYGY